MKVRKCYIFFSLFSLSRRALGRCVKLHLSYKVLPPHQTHWSSTSVRDVAILVARAWKKLNSQGVAPRQVLRGSTYPIMFFPPRPFETPDGPGLQTSFIKGAAA